MSVPGSLPPSEEARVHHRSQLERDAVGSAWTGWVTFAACILALLGLINMFQGLLALFDEGYFLVPGEDLVLVSYDAWGVLLILWGGLLLLLGLALNAGREWARWIAALAVGINVIAQIGFFPSSPFLSMVLIALDVVVLYALTVRWEEAQRGA